MSIRICLGVAFGLVFVAATGAGTWTAYSYSHATAQQQAAELAAEPAAEPAAFSAPAVNAASKGDRLTASTTTGSGSGSGAGSIWASIPLPSRGGNAAAPGQIPTTAYSVVALTSTPAETPGLRLEPRKLPGAAKAGDKPSQLDKAQRAEQQKLLLDDAQIAALRTRLNLTPTQEEFWPPVEASLRDVVRAHARKSRGSKVAAQIDVNSAEVQQLINAAVPLITRLSEEQKREVRQLARIIGLETVAQRI